MGRRKRGARVLGPYERPDGLWQVAEVGASGARTYCTFADKGEAGEYVAAARAEIGNAYKTIDEAIDGYERHLKEKGNKEKSYKETVRRLRLFVGDDMHKPFSLLTAKWAARRYTWLRTEYVPARCHPPLVFKSLSVDAHRNILAEVRTFFAWCIPRYLAVNPLAAVQGVGKRRHGKPQLRIDEARRWEAKALELAAAGEAGAACALTVLYCQLRASEAVGVQVRDLDDDGRILWVADSKTEAGRRQNEVPDHLRPHLQELAEGKPGTALLFGYHDRGWPNDWVHEICRQAGVPEVCAHSQRGLASSLGFAAGMLGSAIARALGHEDVSTTTTSYAKREAVLEGQRARGLTVLRGGK